MEPNQVSLDEFNDIVSQAIQTIPQDFLDKLDNVSIVAQDLPSAYQMSKMKLRDSHSLLGLYEGIPLTRRGYYAGALPDKITLFRLPILRIASGRVEVITIIKETVWHEVAHHFGMNESAVRQAEANRRRRIK